MASAESPAPRPRPLPIHGPLSVLGAVAGIIAAGTIVPGCVFSEGQTERLHVVMPMAMPIALFLASLWLARRLAPAPQQSRRRWILTALGMTLAAEAGFNLVAALAYEPSHVPSSWLWAFAVFAPVHVLLFPAVLLVVVAARALVTVRPGSLAANAARRQVWMFALGSIGPIEASLWTLHDGPMSTPARVAWWISAAALPVMAALLAADVRAARLVARLLPERRVRASGTPVATSAQRLDLGIGEETYAPEPAPTYRSSAAADLLIIGEPEPALRFLAKLRNRAAIVLAVAITSTAIARAMLVRAPPPREHIDFTWPGSRCQLAPDVAAGEPAKAG
jgi:hypothetical protein